MVKVYLPSFAICTFSLAANLLVLGSYPFPTVAQESTLPTSEGEEEVASANVEPEILSEINRVRTNPQGYAHWLEEQKQYYDHIWLRLPGEKPIRAHRLERAINEAIAVLKEQEPLPALTISEQTAATASKKLEAFAKTNQDIQNISYGRITPKGIVMSLVVDELFPDRRRRNNLLSPNADDTGVVCRNDPRYSKVCAIAYSNSTTDNIAQEKPETPANEKPVVAVSQVETPANEKPEEVVSQPEVASQPETSPEQESVTAADSPDIPDTKATSERVEASPENTSENIETASNELPQPPQPQAPPTPAVLSETATSEAEKAEEEENVSEAESEENTATNEDIEIARAEEPEQEEEVVEEPEQEEELEAEEPDDREEVFEAEEPEEEEPEKIATNSDRTRLLENVERGVLEEGDRIIEEDGSFYDSYPLEAQSGESFNIALESDEFDAFVALIDAQGNIIEQNDDINEEDSNSKIRVTIPESGTYNIIVNAYDEGGTGQYILTISR
ncbi:MAG: pre-peptidase C-terminal domain-containing protein [Cyanobacteria bacterium P01_G01_bin.19]